MRDGDGLGNARLRCGVRVVFMAIALFQAPGAGAVDMVDIVDDIEGVTVGMLRGAYDYHLEAAGRMIGAMDADGLTSADLDRLAHRWSTATVARFEYTYVQRGRPHTVVYHAISGQEANHILGLSVPDMTSYYPVSVMDRRAMITAAAGSRLAPPEVGHVMDAEIKGFRSIEKDIVSGKLPRGGRLNIWVSQPACASCRRVASSFEDGYGVRTTVHQWMKRETPGDSPFRQLSTHRRRGGTRLRHWRKQASSLTSVRVLIAGCLP